MATQRVRIGYVIGQLHYGGAERQLYELVRGLDANRFECVVYCLSDRVVPYGRMIEKTGSKVRIIHRRGHFDITRIFRLAALLRQDRIDVLHAYLVNANGYALPAWLLTRIPYLVTSVRNCQGIGWFRDWINRLAFWTSDAIVCNGEAVRTFAAQHYRAPHEKSVVIYNGLDLARFSITPLPIKVENGHQCQGPAGRQILTIGRLVPQKDLTLFLDAAALLLQKEPNVHFVIVGDGPYRETLERYASQRGLDERVSFLGERSDVPALLHRTDVFWLTSAWEGLSNVLLEALACAKPVVARDVGACREIVCHGINGYLVPGRDAEKFVQHTLELLTNPARAKEIGLAGKKRAVEQFSVPTMVRATERLYDTLLNSRIGSVGSSLDVTFKRSRFEPE